MEQESNATFVILKSKVRLRMRKSNKNSTKGVLAATEIFCIASFFVS